MTRRKSSRSSSSIYSHNMPSSSNYHDVMTASSAPSRGQQGVLRIRTPHPHDVLCGRGGGINSHEGNVVFRDWVHERKNDYNLAANKSEKARVARDVVNRVRNLNPPGRFLTKDPASGDGFASWWVEIDDVKAMAKTSQALREGAPSIRAKHKEELEKAKGRTASSRRKPARKTSTGSTRKKAEERKDEEPEAEESSTSSMAPPASLRMSPTSTEKALQTAYEAARQQVEAQALPPPPLVSSSKFTTEYASSGRPAKMSRVISDAMTPPLLPTEEPCFPLPLSKKSESSSESNMKRSHSLALSDMSNNELCDEFVNPFEDESVDSRREREAILKREGSDLGGIGALLSNNHHLLSPPPRQRSSNSIGVNNNNGALRNSTSSRSTSVLSDVSSLSEVPQGDGEIVGGRGTNPMYPAPGTKEEASASQQTSFRGSGSPLTRRLSPKMTNGLGTHQDVLQ